MRTRSAALATFAALAGIGLAAVPANAASAPAPVSSISVTPQIDSRGTVSVDVSWTGADPSADGVVVCLKRGTSAPATPDTCESNVAVNPPATSSGPITFFPAKTYVVAVYDYIGTTPEPTYSAPTFAVRHGTKLTFGYACGSYTKGSHCTISSVLKDVYRGASLGHRPVELWVAGTQKNAPWSRLARMATDGTGHAHTTITLTQSRLYQWRYVNVGAHELTTYSARYQIAVTS